MGTSRSDLQFVPIQSPKHYACACGWLWGDWNYGDESPAMDGHRRSAEDHGNYGEYEMGQAKGPWFGGPIGRSRPDENGACGAWFCLPCTFEWGLVIFRRYSRRRGEYDLEFCGDPIATSGGWGLCYRPVNRHAGEYGLGCEGVQRRRFVF